MVYAPLLPWSLNLLVALAQATKIFPVASGLLSQTFLYSSVALFPFPVSPTLRLGFSPFLTLSIAPLIVIEGMGGFLCLF